MRQDAQQPLRLTRSLLSLSCLALCFGIAGCTVGPNYHRPTVETPAGWKEQPPEGWKNAAPSDTISKGNWWEVFGSPQLNAYEQQAIAANQTLRAAAENVLVARATSRAVRSEQFPQVSLQPSAATARISGTRPTQPGSPLVAYQSNTYTLPGDVTYLVDLWGSVRRQVESSRALTQASVADYENVLLTVKADVAEYYIMVRFIDQEMAILQNNMALQQQALQLTQTRRAGGVASGLDVSEAETLLDTTQGDYIGLGVQRAQFEHALAVLLGKPPAAFSMPSDPLVLAPPPIPTGLPSDLLERRPDVAAAERAMAANNAQIGVARAAYYPALSLSGDLGLLTNNLDRLITVPAIIWGVGANAVQPLFTGGLLSANMQKARATYDGSVANYRQTVLTAFQQVEDGISGLRVLELQAAAYDKAVTSAQTTVDISTARYREGLANFIEVIDAQVTLLQNQRTADGILEQRLLTTVSLVQALGGGWTGSTTYAPAPEQQIAPAQNATGAAAPAAPSAAPAQR